MDIDARRRVNIDTDAGSTSAIETRPEGNATQRGGGSSPCAGGCPHGGPPSSLGSFLVLAVFPWPSLAAAQSFHRTVNEGITSFGRRSDRLSLTLHTEKPESIEHRVDD